MGSSQSSVKKSSECISEFCCMTIKCLKTKRTQKTLYLPWDLIVEILLRLPVKSLLRFKCVCKSWLSFISDPHFATSHFEIAAAARTERLVFASKGPYALQFQSIDFNASFYDKSASAVLKLDFLGARTKVGYRNHVEPRPNVSVHFIGSCNGFLLVYMDGVLFVWNPSTSAHKFIDSSPIVSSSKSLIFLMGFGYDSSTDDYLVVEASCNPKSGDGSNHVEYFSLRANVWKEIETTHLPYTDYCYNPRDYHRTGYFLSGAIHWVAFNYDTSMDVIVVFDLTERRFSEIPLPVDFHLHNMFYFLEMLGELLYLYVHGTDQSVEIWVMQEYKLQSSWTKTIVVPTRGILIDQPYMYAGTVICSTKSGDIVATNLIDTLMKINDKGQLQEYRSYINEIRACWATAYTESLLSLPCDSEQAKEDDKHQKLA